MVRRAGRAHQRQTPLERVGRARPRLLFAIPEAPRRQRAVHILQHLLRDLLPGGHVHHGEVVGRQPLGRGVYVRVDDAHVVPVEALQHIRDESHAVWDLHGDLRGVRELVLAQFEPRVGVRGLAAHGLQLPLHGGFHLFFDRIHCVPVGAFPHPAHRRRRRFTQKADVVVGEDTRVLVVELGPKRLAGAVSLHFFNLGKRRLEHLQPGDPSSVFIRGNLRLADAVGVHGLSVHGALSVHGLSFDEFPIAVDVLSVSVLHQAPGCSFDEIARLPFVGSPPVAGIEL